MRCTLLIPDLFWPGDGAKEVAAGLELPALEMLLARADAIKHPPLATEAWLCQAFEVERQQDWPVAPLTLALDGGEPGTHYWLRADPVHLEVGRDRIVLIESSLFELDAHEAAAFVATLDAHFGGRGISFAAPVPTRWYARIARAPRIVTRLMSEVGGGDVNALLPAGADALEWHAAFNEAQMLLHDHPVNAAREAAGAPTVNSIWLWGGGTQTAVKGRHFDTVASDEELAPALAVCAGVPARRVTARAPEWLPGAGAGADTSHLVVLTGLAQAVRYRDAAAWRSRIAALEGAWFAPLLSALRKRELEQVTLVAPCTRHCWRFEISFRDLLRFWRRPRGLSVYA
jgi:hypothetical protein